MRIQFSLIVICLTVIIMTAPGVPLLAQDAPNAWTTYQLNMRTGPDTSYAVIAVLESNTGVIVEGRNADQSWLLIHTEDNAHRGWLAGLYLIYAEGFNGWNLPITDEVVAAPAAAPEPANPGAPGPAVPAAVTTNYAGFDMNRVASIDISVIPPIPSDLGRARAIFLQGRAQGRNPHVVSRVGDCHTTDPHFLTPYAGGGDAVTNWFGESFGYRSYAADTGYSTVAALAPDLADPSVCLPGETPLQCEYRVHNSSVSVIMLGTMDLLVTTPAQFDANLRRVVDLSISMGVIPVLSTVPRHRDNPDGAELYNKIIVQVTRDYNIPLLNTWVALEWGSNHGLAADGWHLSAEHGFPARNQVTFEMLGALLSGAMY